MRTFPGTFGLFLDLRCKANVIYVLWRIHCEGLEVLGAGVDAGHIGQVSTLKVPEGPRELAPCHPRNMAYDSSMLNEPTEALSLFDTFGLLK